MLERIGNYTLETPPGRGGSPIRRDPRVNVTPTLGGNIATILQGDLADELLEVPFPLLDATPAKTIIRAYAATAVVSDTLIPDQRLAYKVPVAAGGFAALSAARMTLRQAGMTGTVDIEIWDDAAGDPGVRVGILATLDADDIGAVFGEIDVFGQAAWPLLTPGGWLIVNGDNMTAGTISWAGEGVTANAHAKYTAGAWALANGELSATVWQGGQYPVLLGLVGAYDQAGQTYEVAFKGGERHTAILAKIEAQNIVTPSAIGDDGHAAQVTLELILQ